jgi:glycosyltransferase involved in cell wall biosynthesis
MFFARRIFSKGKFHLLALNILIKDIVFRYKMDLAICIVVKNRSNLVVYQEDPIETYRHIADKIQGTPSDSHFPPTLNRDATITLNLLPKLLMSLRMIKTGNDNWTVIIVDYESTDVNVAAIAHQILDGHIRCVVHTEKAVFSVGSGRHIGATIAKERGHDTIFFCDTDMYFTHRYVFDRAAEAIQENKVYYPMCFSFTQADHMKGFWRDTGYGMLFIKTSRYFEGDKWQHNVSWGEEDNIMFNSFNKSDIVRGRAHGFFHQWHPNSIVFKTLEYPVKYYAGKAAVQKTENSQN